MILARLLACSEAVPPEPRDTGGTDSRSEPASDTADDSTPPPDSTTTDPPESWPKACSEIYDPDELVTFSMAVTTEEWAGFASDCSAWQQTYRPVEFTWEGETVSAMARLKGNWSWTCDKYQFVVSFNEEDPAGRFHGVRKTILDAPWYDQTLLHERIAYPQFEARGLPYSCANNARLVVNGTYYGLYANLERIDEEYLERHYEEKDGNLYQGGTELKTNEDTADTSRLDALHQARTIDEIAALVNLDQAVAEWATEAMLPALDNYWAGVEINYYLYDHPSRGFEFLPYDLDISFGDSAYTNGQLVWSDTYAYDPVTWQHYGWGKEALVMTVLADAAWCARFVEELRAARAVYDPEAMAAQVSTWEDQIVSAVEADPQKPYSTDAHRASVAALEDYFAERAAYVDAWLATADHCPARW